SPRSSRKLGMKRDLSALTRRQNPAQRGASVLRDGAVALTRPLLRDRLSTFLLVAAIALSIVFFSLLGATKPSSAGKETPLSTVTQQGARHKITAATFLDQDARVVVKTTYGELEWAAYPSSDAETSKLITDMSAASIVVTVDQQAGKPVKAILVQF